MGEDKRLDRIYDYTKWHMGVYFSAAGALTAGFGYVAKAPQIGKNMQVLEHPWILLLAIVSLLLAGVCGAIIASSCTECKTYEELWEGKQGPYSLKLYAGRVWARCEHGFFWIAVVLLTTSVFYSSAVLCVLGVASSQSDAKCAVNDSAVVKF